MRIHFTASNLHRFFPPGWKPRLYGRQDARRYIAFMTTTSNETPRFGQTDWVSGRTLGLIMFAGILTIVMSLVSPNFLTQETFFSQSRYIAFYVLVAMAQAICLAIGDMNLAVGAVGSIATVAFGLLVAPDHGNMSP